MTPLAVLTMVYDDEIFLKIWLSYWSRFLPRENLYVLIHGDYEAYENLAEGCNTIRIPRPEVHGRTEIKRWEMIARISSGLTSMFGKVIYTDVDEIIALDPKQGSDLVEHILGLHDPIVAPYGCDVVDPVELDLPPFDEARLILEQRPYVASNAHYAKPCIIGKPVEWCSGGHYCKERNVTLSDDLFLFHLRLFDRRVYTQRAAKRIAMVTDVNTGQAVDGFGGPTWRRSNELERYSIETMEALPNLRFKRDREMWRNEVREDEQGFFVRKGKMRKQLHRVPLRFESLF